MDAYETPQRWNGEGSHGGAGSVLDDSQSELRDPRYRAELLKHPFSVRAFLFLLEPAAVLRWITLSGLVLLVAKAGHFVYASSDTKQMLFGVIVGLVLVPVGTVSVALVSVCCLAIVQETANGAKWIKSWPDVNVMDWLLESFYILNALFFSLLPGALIGQLLMLARPDLPRPMPILLGGGLTVFLLFPPMLLSILASGSATSPASPVILRSVRSLAGTWKTFYLWAMALTITGLVAFWLMIVASLSSMLGLMLCVLLAGVVTAIMMMYFRLLGRLGWVILEHTEDEIEEEDPSDDEAPAAAQ